MTAAEKGFQRIAYIKYLSPILSHVMLHNLTPP